SHSIRKAIGKRLSARPARKAAAVPGRREDRNNSHLDTETELSKLELELTHLRARAEDLQEQVNWLQKSRNYYAALVDEGPVGFVILDELGAIHECNQVLASMMGLQKPLAQPESFSRYVV